MFYNSQQIVWIVAGGPSLKGFDWSFLLDKPHIAVNKAFLDCPQASIVYWSDTRFWKWHVNQLAEHPGWKCAGTDVHKTQYPPYVARWAFDGIKGLSLKPGCLRSGNNSGYAAINLAVQLGARRIGLLGFDMKTQPDADHYHGGYPGFPLRERTLKEKMLPFFNTITEPLDMIKVKVINYNDDTDLCAFPILRLENCYEDSHSR